MFYQGFCLFDLVFDLGCDLAFDLICDLAEEKVWKRLVDSLKRFYLAVFQDRCLGNRGSGIRRGGCSKKDLGALWNLWSRSLLRLARVVPKDLESC